MGLALIIPGLLQKPATVAGGEWRFILTIALICHACAGSTGYSRRYRAGKISAYERRPIPDDLYGDDYRGLAQSRPLLLPIVGAFALINSAFAAFVPNEYSFGHHLKPPGDAVASACRLPRAPR